MNKFENLKAGDTVINITKMKHIAYHIFQPYKVYEINHKYIILKDCSRKYFKADGQVKNMDTIINAEDYLLPINEDTQIIYNLYKNINNIGKYVDNLYRKLELLKNVLLSNYTYMKPDINKLLEIEKSLCIASEKIDNLYD